MPSDSCCGRWGEQCHEPESPVGRRRMTSAPSGKAKCLQHWRTALLMKVPSERHTQCMSLSVTFALEAVPVTLWATAHRWTVPMARDGAEFNHSSRNCANYSYNEPAMNSLLNFERRTQWSVWSAPFNVHFNSIGRSRVNNVGCCVRPPFD